MNNYSTHFEAFSHVFLRFSSSLIQIPLGGSGVCFCLRSIGEMISEKQNKKSKKKKKKRGKNSCCEIVTNKSRLYSLLLSACLFLLSRFTAHFSVQSSVFFLVSSFCQLLSFLPSLFSLFFSQNGSVLTGGRTLLAAARSGNFIFPSFVERVNSRGSPFAAILCQSLWSSTLLLLSIDALMQYFGFVAFLFDGKRQKKKKIFLKLLRSSALIQQILFFCFSRNGFDWAYSVAPSRRYFSCIIKFLYVCLLPPCLSFRFSVHFCL